MAPPEYAPVPRSEPELASPRGRQRLQTARIHAVDGHVRLDGLVGGRANTALIFDAVARQAAREVQHALALIDAFQALRDGLDRIEFAVGVQAVVLAVVRGEGACIVRRAIA